MTVALFDRQTRNGTDRDIRSFAGTTLPILQHHLQMAAAVGEQRDDEPLIRTGVVARAVSIERCAFRGPTVVSAKAETQRLFVQRNGRHRGRAGRAGDADGRWSPSQVARVNDHRAMG